MEAAGVPLVDYIQGRIYRGILTGLNTAFVIDSAKRSELIARDPNSTELIKPLAVGDDVRRWRIRAKERFLIVTPIGVNIRRYPAVLAHLRQWQTALEKRWDKGEHWWELRACDYYDKFDQPKIAFPDIAKEPRFCWDNEQYYFNNTTYFMPTSDIYLLGVLNSSSMWSFAKERLTVLGDAEKGGRLRFFTQFVQALPIPLASSMDRAAIAALVQKCLDAKGVGCEQWEADINERVAQLYGIANPE